MRQVLDTGLRVVGPDDLLTLITRQEIARALADQGRTAAAETEFRQALDAHMRVVGPDNPSTLATRHDIARMLAAQGRTVDAETEFRQVLGAELRALGPDHPSTLATRHEIARMLADHNKPAEAEAEFRQVLDARMRSLDLTTLKPWVPGTTSPGHWPTRAGLPRPRPSSGSYSTLSSGSLDPTTAPPWPPAASSAWFSANAERQFQTTPSGVLTLESHYEVWRRP